jgi:hypothetical protein
VWLCLHAWRKSMSMASLSSIYSRALSIAMQYLLLRLHDTMLADVFRAFMLSSYTTAIMRCRTLCKCIRSLIDKEPYVWGYPEKWIIKLIRQVHLGRANNLISLSPFSHIVCSARIHNFYELLKNRHHFSTRDLPSDPKVLPKFKITVSKLTTPPMYVLFFTQTFDLIFLL